MEIVTISCGKNPAFVDQHFWNILQKNPTEYHTSFYSDKDDYVPRSITYCHANDVGPTPWGTDISELNDAAPEQVINNKKQQSEYHQNYFNKNSDTYKQAYAQSGAILYTAWQNDQLQDVEDARIQLKDVQLPTDYQENQRTFNTYNDFSHEKEDLLDQIRLQLEKCDIVDSLVLFQEPDYQFNQLPILDYLSENVPKKPVFVYDIDQSAMKHKQIYQTQLNYNLNEYMSHGILVRHKTEEIYRDSASVAVQLAQFLKQIKSDKQEVDNIIRGIQTTPIQNFINIFQELEGQLDYHMDVESLVQQSYSSILFSDEKTDIRHNRWLQVHQAQVQLSETFPFIFEKIQQVDWRTQVKQQQLLYNGRDNRNLLERGVDLFRRMRHQSVFGIDEDDYGQTKEFAYDQFEAYGGQLEPVNFSDSDE